MEKDYSQQFTLRVLTLLLWVVMLAFTGNAAADIQFLNKLLADNHLNQGTRPQFEIDTPAVNQSPANNKPATRPDRGFDFRDTIQILAPVVIDELRRVTVPDLQGKTIQQAERILKQSKLKRGAIKKTQIQRNSEVIVRQYPAVNKRVTVGTAVDLYVAKVTVAEQRKLIINIKPHNLTRRQGETARFTGNASMKVVTGNGSQIVDVTHNQHLSWQWKYGNQTSQKNTFSVDTRNFKKGEHSVSLVVTLRPQFDASFRAATNTKRYEAKTILTIKSALITVPSVLNRDKMTAIEILKRASLSVGNTQIVEMEKGSDDTALVPLVTHEFSSKNEPHLKVLLNNIELSDISITVKLKLKLSGITLKIQHGRIQKIIAGKGNGKGIISYHGVPITEKEILGMDLPAEIVIPEKLTMARPKELTAQKPVQSQSPAVDPSSSSRQTDNHPAP